MRILVEIVHPADVLFFLRPIRIFLERGDIVTVASRHKDVACALLDGFHVEHIPISRQRRGLARLSLEMIQREWSLIRLVRRSKPHIMLGFGGVAISHVGRMLGVPTVAIYDSENARLQTRLTWPFIDHLVVPEDYDGPVPAGRTSRLRGTKELSYFHPSAFRADRRKAIQQGLDPDQPNIFIRLVSWRAAHDFGKSGWSESDAARLADALAPRAKLHVSTEAEIPAPLRPYQWTGIANDVHHLIASCNAFAGESATMACEAVVMGVPAVYAGVDFPGYTRGLARQGLLTILAPSQRGYITDATIALLERRKDFVHARKLWLETCPDWANEVVAQADSKAKRASE